MSMQRIDVPGADRVMATSNRRQRELERFMSTRRQAETQRCIDGLATAYNRVHQHPTKGHLEVMVEGCFAKSLASGRQIDFCLDHDRAITVGSTRAGLVLEDAADGLLFRLEVPANHVGAAAARMVEINQKASMSVGYRIVASETLNIGGHDVRFITEAELEEISLCRNGAVPNTFAMIADSRMSPRPTAKERSVEFRLEHLARKATNCLAALQKKSAEMLQAISAQEGPLLINGRFPDELAAEARAFARTQRVRS
jgi:HK97 family phage prohead protease